MDTAFWSTLSDILILLTAALVFGAIAERLHFSAILGYLLAGTLLGPHALQWVSNEDQVRALAELGVALLLFSIGLEFSWQRLRKMGAIALAGGSLQVLVTLIFAASVTRLFGLTTQTSIAVGAIIALSSTACVLRLLMSRAELESIHGRLTLGILLMQDIAVVPLMLLVSVLGGEKSTGDMVAQVLTTIVLGGMLFAVFYLLFNYVVPAILNMRSIQRNRELPILLAIVMGLGSAWAAHRLNLSPAMGAFVAGILLAESPFSTQIRADISSLRTLLMTLFFSAIGMLGDPGWIADHWAIVAGVVAAIVIGKTMIIWIILRFFGKAHRDALKTGLCLAQVGEFSFVLAAVAFAAGVLSVNGFKLIISATIATLFLTPLLVAGSSRVASFIVSGLERIRLLRKCQTMPVDETGQPTGHTIIVGFGPAGLAVGETILTHGQTATVLDLNQQHVQKARRMGLNAYVGDASHHDVLQHVHICTAAAVVITLPDPATVRLIIHLVRGLAPGVSIIARARYHVYRWELELAGAHAVIDEEEQVGHRLADALLDQANKSVDD